MSVGVCFDLVRFHSKHRFLNVPHHVGNGPSNTFSAVMRLVPVAKLNGLAFACRSAGGDFRHAAPATFQQGSDLYRRVTARIQDF
jgi:hypothetical protein